MNVEASIEAALPRLRELVRQAQGGDPELKRITDARDQVLQRYQLIFQPEKLGSISEEDFRQFLMFRNNMHWASLQRMGPAICSDMVKLRGALQTLLDEDRPLRERLNALVPSRGPALVPRLSKAVLTPILLICHPERYGVWNQTSEGGMKALGLWPDMKHNCPFGERYEEVNAVLLAVSRALSVDLWTLDALWWRVNPAADERPELTTPQSGISQDAPPEAFGSQRFGLEKHLQEFLRDNWDKTPLGRVWKLHEEDGDPEAGYEYPCDVGRIDLLAHHRGEPRWLVVELKRNQSGDQTVGQVLRYMGWVGHNLAKPGEQVEGLVIAASADSGMRYALDVTPTVALKFYEVEFRLKDSESID